ncbi:MAG: Pseudouridine synthase [Flavipsychrobacter sp.]|nr:Pseudouridine synthase [Flavipsychrobacter sp.]
MRKSSSHTPRNSKPGAKNTFKKDDGRKSFGKDDKPSFKKNYDGRSPSGDDRPARKAKPYSGRTSDSDKPRPFGKPGGKDTDDSRPRRDFNKSGGDSRPFSDRPKRSFDKPRSSDGDSRPFSDRPKRSFDKPRSSDGESRPFSDRPKRSFDKPRSSDGDSRPFSDRPKRSFDKPRSADGEKRPFSDRPKPSFRKEEGGEDRPRKSYDKPRSADGEKRPFSDRPKRSFDKPSFRKEEGGSGDKAKRSFDKPKGAGGDSRPFRDRPKTDKPSFDKGGKGKKFDKPEDEKPTFKDVMDKAFNQPKSKKVAEEDDIIFRPQQFEDQVFGELEDAGDEDKPKPVYGKKKAAAPVPDKPQHIEDKPSRRKKKWKDEDDEDEDDEDKEINQTNGPRLEMPLNKFIAHSGECSRRDAAALVRQGKVKVNEELVLDPGYRVKHDDKVTMSGKKLVPQTGMVYILLNKPKGFITTNDDPQGRKTVMELVASSGVDRLFPVGRLDRDTSGLLLITNDGDLTQKLCHPSYAIKKVYQVTTDKPVTHADFEKILAGVDLEDGIAQVDALSYLEKKTELGLEIHSGRNRIVRRIFESLGYTVEKLDRVMYAGLTKKNLPRSKWRYLNDREVVLLKHFKS